MLKAVECNQHNGIAGSSMQKQNIFKVCRALCKQTTGCAKIGVPFTQCPITKCFTLFRICYDLNCAEQIYSTHKLKQGAV